MLKKLFGGTQVPTKIGKSEQSKSDRVRLVKIFELELSNMEGAPVYSLTHQLSIGSEIGNIVIADPSVSPRHCTFTLQEEVVSVIDHGSIDGTFVNGKKIPSGKYFILEESDVIAVGDLEIRIKVHSESQVVRGESGSPVTVESANEAENVSNSGPSLLKMTSTNKSEKTKLNIRPEYATNSLVRVAALTLDFLFSYTAFVVFSPFDEFRTFLKFIPDTFAELTGISWNFVISVISSEHEAIGQIVKDSAEFLTTHFHLGSLLLIFILSRVVGTLFLGVSVAEFLLGVRASGNILWKRFGGVIRVCLGVITGPFLIFDFPAVISRRTFKEFMTFTQTYLSSKWLAFFVSVIFIPLSVALALMSPLIQGLELPEAIAVNEVIDRQIKVVPAQGSESQQPLVTESGHFFNLALSYDPSSIELVPLIKFRGERSKVNYRPQVGFYHKELQRTVRLELLKKFDLKQLLGIGMKSNFFLYDQFPEIYNFVFTSDTNNPVFKLKISEKSEAKFALEVINFTKIALELSAENVLEVMQNNTPLIKGLLDYKSSLLGLLEYKDFDKISFVKIGNGTFMRVSYLKVAPFDLLIPLIRGEGKIFKVQFDKRENMAQLSDQFYKNSLNGANWFPEKIEMVGETMTPLETLDFFSEQFNSNEVRGDSAQALYGFFYEKSAAILSSFNQTEYDLWKESVENAFKVMEVIRLKKTLEVSPETDQDPRNKLFQNFRDLKSALDTQNLEYFGVANQKI